MSLIQSFCIFSLKFSPNSSLFQTNQKPQINSLDLLCFSNSKPTTNCKNDSSPGYCQSFLVLPKQTTQSFFPHSDYETRARLAKGEEFLSIKGKRFCSCGEKSSDRGSKCWNFSCLGFCDEIFHFCGELSKALTVLCFSAFFKILLQVSSLLSSVLCVILKNFCLSDYFYNSKIIKILYFRDKETFSS